MDLLKDLHSQLNSLVWGPPMMILLIGAGLVLTWVTRGVQFRKLAFSFREVLGKLFHAAEGVGTVTPFQALSTALASTVGVGNIAGVSTAIFLGGPGSLVWLLAQVRHGDGCRSTKFFRMSVGLGKVCTTFGVKTEPLR